MMPNRSTVSDQIRKAFRKSVLRLVWAVISAVPFLLMAQGAKRTPEPEIYVTCKPAYYAEMRFERPNWFKGDRVLPCRILLVPLAADCEDALTNFTPSVLSPNAFVATLVTPEKFAGRTVTLGFEYHAPRNLNPDVLYEVACRPSAIGQLSESVEAYCCNWGVSRGPLTDCTPDELRNWITERRFRDAFVRAMREQCGEKVLFDVMYGVLTNSSSAFDEHSVLTNTFSPYEQTNAAGILRKYRTPCPLSARDAVRGTLGNWDESSGEWPAYLRICFGKESLLAVITELEKTDVSAAERVSLEMLRFWLEGDDPK